jgi:cysteine synthase A
MDWLARHGERDLTAVAIAPDLGERYLDTVYQPDWVQEFYAEDEPSSARPSRRFRHADAGIAAGAPA